MTSAFGLTFLSGPNFSGRTALLESWAHVGQAPSQDSQPSVYLSPSAFECLSGLTMTVADELRIHGRPNKHLEVEEELGVSALLSKTLWTLSGGELAKVIVCAGMRMEPHRLAIDCTLEELDSAARQLLYRTLAVSNREREIFVADNRWSAVDIANCTVQILEATPSAALLAPNASLIQGKISGLLPTTLEADGISAGYGKHIVLRNLSLRLEPGGVYYLNGANGAGKSTLAKVLTGVLSPNAGQLYLNGSRYLPWRHGNKAIALHFQNPDFGRTQESARKESEALNRRLSATSDSNWSKAYCQLWNHALGNLPVYEESIQGLPYVIRKRVDLAACLASGASWYFLDEPTLGQDDTFVHHLAQMLTMLVGAGAGVIVVSHDNPLGRHLSGLPIELHNGALTIGASGSTGL